MEDESVARDDVDLKVLMANGRAFEISVQKSQAVGDVRQKVEIQHPVPPATFLKLMQNGQVLLDTFPVSKLDPSQPMFAVVARDTRTEVLLQAAGTFEGYNDLLQKAQVSEDGEVQKMLVVGSMPSILAVLEEMGGNPEEFVGLRPGATEGTLEIDGEDGALLVPSLDASVLSSRQPDAAISHIIITAQVNSDSYNRGLGIGIEPSPLLDETLADDGLPFYTYNDLGVTKKKNISIIKFHPGMGGGELRLEGFGGWKNSDIGFTPKNWKDAGGKFHTLEFWLAVDGDNKFQITGTEEGQVWAQNWKNKLFDGRYLPSVFAWIDLGGSMNKPLHVGQITMKAVLSSLRDEESSKGKQTPEV